MVCVCVCVYAARTTYARTYAPCVTHDGVASFSEAGRVGPLKARSSHQTECPPACGKVLGRAIVVVRKASMVSRWI
jgi:hypothetical protein